MNQWDRYFLTICHSVATKSPCLSRQIGAILVRNCTILSTGFNGPPRGVPHCEGTCKRKVAGFKSGEGMHLCHAVHAEENAVSNAARNGTKIDGSILFMNSVIPCSKCFGILINSGIIEVVIAKLETYDEHTQFLIDNSVIKIREFDL